MYFENNLPSSPRGVDFTAEVVDFSPGKHSRNSPRVREKYKGLVSKSEIPSCKIMKKKIAMIRSVCNISWLVKWEIGIVAARRSSGGGGKERPCMSPSISGW